MNKKVLKGLAAVMVAVTGLSLTGCGGNSTVGKSDVEYVTWLNAGEDNPVIDGFMKENPDIKVKMNILDGKKYEQLMQPRMMSDDAPDVMIMQMDLFGKYKKENWLSDLSDTEAAKKIKGNAGMMSILGNQNGELYGIPVEGGVSSIMIYYNKKIFDKYSIEVPKTEEEFFAACETLKQNNVDAMVFGGADAWTIAGAFGNALSNEYSMSVLGVDYSDQVAEGKIKYSETQKKGFETFEKLLQNGYVAKNSASLTYEQSVQYFADGKAAMIAQGSWLADLEQITEASADVLDLGVFVYPCADKNADGKRVVNTVVSKCLVVPKQAKNSESAKKLVDYFVSEPVLKEYLERQNLKPVLEGVEVANNPVFDSYFNELDDESKTEKVFYKEKYILPNALSAANQTGYQNMLAGSSAAEELKKLDDEFEMNKDKIEKND